MDTRNGHPVTADSANLTIGDFVYDVTLNGEKIR